MANVSDRIEATKNTITDPLPTPPSTTKQKVQPEELLKRLRWGEPALTIFDIRDRDAFNGERITGAVPMPLTQLPNAAEPMLEYQRDIYVYGDRDEAVADAANRLRQVGFQNVAELQGGLSAWKAVDGPVEGVYAFPSPVDRPQPTDDTTAEPTDAAPESAPESADESQR